MSLRSTVTVLVVVVVAAACGEAAAPSTAGPSASDSVATALPTVAATPAPSGNPIHVLVLGDSIGIPRMGCGTCQGFDAQYALWLEGKSGRPVKVDNQARPNAQIQDLQSVLDTEPAVQQQIAAADIVVVTIGYNNGPNWDPTDPCHAPVAASDAEGVRIALEYLKPACVAATLAEFGTRLETLYGRIEALAAGHVQVRVSLGVFANLDGNPGGDGTLAQLTADEMSRAITQYNGIIDAWNVMDCAAAKKYGFVCGDIHHAFNGPDGTARVAGLVNPNDYVHPNVAGQAKIAALLEAIDVTAATGR